MPEATQEAFDQAQAAADAAWAERDSFREPMRSEISSIVGSLEGVTGLGAGPGAERLIDAFLDFGEMNADKLDHAAVARQNALNAQATRDDIAENLPEAPPIPIPSLLESSDESAVRAWLLTANDVDVTAALATVLNVDDQRGWAFKLMKWGRADGNTAQVFAAINQYIVPASAPAPTGSAQIPETASAADEPVSPDGARQTPPAGTVQDVLDWVGTDQQRALAAIDNEIQHDDPREDLVAAANAIIDGGAPPAAETPAAPEATEPTGDPAPAEGDNG